ncbi:MAG: phosphotransferase family protein [Hyphomonadaceae bacterium]|nr:phosphotransferase family protein [Hyphomonadaceae bacterium]
MSDLDVIAAGLGRVVRRMAGPQARASAIRRLSGGASQEIWAFDVEGHGPRGYILRRAQGGAPHSVSAQSIGLATEAAVIEAAGAAGAPAPRVVHVCDEEDGLGAAYVMERLAGETIARKILRDDVFASARAGLARQCGGALARIHATPAHTLPPLPYSDALEQLDRYEELYRSFDTPRPVFQLAFKHLRTHLPRPATTTLVHGDFRLGNLMIDATGLVAALDWEIAHLGDPAEDLSWICTPSWRFGQMDRPVGGFGDLEDLIDGYRDAGGHPRVTAEAVRAWTVFGSLKWGVMCLLMYRAYEFGVDRSVERAAIGRRASETELDLMLLLTGRL